MANIKIKDFKFPRNGNTYIVPQVDDTLSIEGAVADAKKTGDGISELKEEFTQMESDGVVPSAEQILTDKGVTDCVPYHYRKTGGDGADRLYDQIVGGTVCFNQIYNVSNSGTRFGITVDVTSGSVAITGTSTEPGSGPTFSWTSFNVPTGHKVVIQKDFALPTGDFIFEQYNGFGNQDVTNRVVNVTNGYLIPQLQIANSGVTYNITGHLCVFDLTQMFGSAVADYIYNLDQSHAGDGVAFFKSLFPNDYYPYNSGELVSVSGLSEHKMVGFNQWDEEWEQGVVLTTNGENYPSVTQIRSKNYIPCLPSTAYYFSTQTEARGLYANVCFYDANKNYISYTGAYSPKSTTNPSYSNPFSPPANCRYMRFTVSVSYGATYKNDICINLLDPAKNGTYKPYKAHSYPLDNTLTLRGVPKLVDGKMCFDGDTYDADGTVTRRYGVVDLGTLNWANAETYYASTTALPNVKAPDSGGTKANAMAEKYMVVTSNGVSGGSESGIGVRPNGMVYVTNTGSAPSGSLVYELATPTTEEVDPYQHLQQCDPNGTEEYVSTGIVPVGHNTQYPENLKAKIEGLPWNFANLIAPTESAFVATRNYTTGALFIVNNVLYKATSNIANGGSITPNTNCTATTIAEIISALA